MDVGLVVGGADGTFVGLFVGFWVGCLVGEYDGKPVGSRIIFDSSRQTTQTLQHEVPWLGSAESQYLSWDSGRDSLLSTRPSQHCSANPALRSPPSIVHVSQEDSIKLAMRIITNNLLHVCILWRRRPFRKSRSIRFEDTSFVIDNLYKSCTCFALITLRLTLVNTRCIIYWSTRWTQVLKK